MATSSAGDDSMKTDGSTQTVPPYACMMADAATVEAEHLVKLVGTSLTSGELEIVVDATDTIQQAKAQFAGALEVDARQLQLLHGSEVLKGGWTIAECGLQNGSQVTIVVGVIPHWTAALDPDHLFVTGEEWGAYALGEPRPGSDVPALRLDMRFASVGHRWTAARLDVPWEIGIVADCMSAYMKMNRLEANGGYCSLRLATFDNEEGLVEIKFDHNKLRGYGTDVVADDFGIPSPTVRANQWLRLEVIFRREGQSVEFRVDDNLLHVSNLVNGPWQRIAAVELRGYASGNTQWWDEVVVKLSDDIAFAC